MAGSLRTHLVTSRRSRVALVLGVATFGLGSFAAFGHPAPASADTYRLDRLSVDPDVFNTPMTIKKLPCTPYPRCLVYGPVQTIPDFTIPDWRTPGDDLTIPATGDLTGAATLGR